MPQTLPESTERTDRKPRLARGGSIVDPNYLTLFRLASVPVLWVVSFFTSPLWLGLLASVAAATDVVDGPLARRTGRQTRKGSQLDSIADHLLTASVAGWLIIHRPEFVAAEWPWLLTWFALGGVALLGGWLKFGRFGDLHLYSAKVAGFAAYLVALWLLAFGSYSAPLFHLVAGLGMIAAIEHLLVLLTRKQVDEHIGSMLLGGRRR